MSKDETPDSYKVGYGKPPRHTQFRKGISGNSKGRPKNAPDLDAEFSKELNSSISIKDSGKRRRISKLQGILKQLANKAVTGDIRAARLILSHYQQLLERTALSAASQPSGPEFERRTRAEEFTEEELTQFLRDYQETEEWMERKKLLSNTE